MVIKDLTPQKALRSPEEMLKHLKGTPLAPKYSAGVWYFYPGASRFHEPYIDVEALGQSFLPFDRSTACFRNRVEVG